VEFERSVMTVLTEVSVKGRELLLDISLGNDTEVERVVQQVVVQGEFTADGMSLGLLVS
jgi:hypothetical protein